MTPHKHKHINQVLANYDMRVKRGTHSNFHWHVDDQKITVASKALQQSLLRVLRLTNLKPKLLPKQLRLTVVSLTMTHSGCH